MFAVEEDKDLAVCDDIFKGYRTVDHTIFDKVECIGKGNPEKVYFSCFYIALCY